jgi:hypothetical protein
MLAWKWEVLSSRLLDCSGCAHPRVERCALRKDALDDREFLIKLAPAREPLRPACDTMARRADQWSTAFPAPHASSV